MSREAIQNQISHLPFEGVPEMAPPQSLVKTCLPGSDIQLDCYPNAPYFNGSSFCSAHNLKFASWLRNPATIALLKAFRNYYREAAREKPPFLVMIVLSGARQVHGYYLHISLFDLLSRWCEHEKLPPSEQRQIPVF